MKSFLAALAFAITFALPASAVPVYLTMSGETGGVDSQAYYLSIVLDDGGLGLANRSFTTADLDRSFRPDGSIIAQIGGTRYSMTMPDYSLAELLIANPQGSFSLTTDATGAVDTSSIDLGRVSDANGGSLSSTGAPFQEFVQLVIFRGSALNGGVFTVRDDVGVAQFFTNSINDPNLSLTLTTSRPTPPPIPRPAGGLLLAAGLGALVLRRRARAS